MLTGLGHALSKEVEPLPDMRSADARSRDIGRPDGVANPFQVRRNKVKPSDLNRPRNLLSKDDWRPALLDEPVPVGPKVPLVSKPLSFAWRAEGLAGAGACPHGTPVRPSGEAEGIGPDSDSGEPVALCEPPDVVGADVPDVTLVYLP